VLLQPLQHYAAQDSDTNGCKSSFVNGNKQPPDNSSGWY
jgi:hypothetical protein